MLICYYKFANLNNKIDMAFIVVCVRVCVYVMAFDGVLLFIAFIS